MRLFHIHKFRFSGYEHEMISEWTLKQTIRKSCECGKKREEVSILKDYALPSGKITAIAGDGMGCDGDGGLVTLLTKE